MAALSPASNVKISEPGASAFLNAVVNGTPQQTSAFDHKPNLRVLNKPKCVQCGNVARSRCPFQCCKSCCFKAQNPCHIHVLKQTSTLAEKPVSTPSPSVEQPPADAQPSSGQSWKLHTLRQLNHNILKALQQRKPPSKRDVVNVNKWRFAKLKEHLQGNAEVANEAFDRYMHNVGLLEEAFSVAIDVVQPEDSRAAREQPSPQERMDSLVSEMKLRLRSDEKAEESFRASLKDMVSHKLEKLQQRHTDGNDSSDHSSWSRSVKQRIKRVGAVNELMDVLNRARGEEDLKLAFDAKSQLFAQPGSPTATTTTTSPVRRHTQPASSHSEPNPPLGHSITTQLAEIDAEFSTLRNVAQL